MDDVTGEEIADWISAINQLNENNVTEETASFEAHEPFNGSGRASAGRAHRTR
jgi:hypothetical protein